MLNSLDVIDLAIHLIFLLTGLCGNIFILTVHFLEWLKTRKHNPCNIIINGIGISNIFLQISSDMAEITYYLCPGAYLEEWIINISISVTASLLMSSLWFSTCLCFYYCVKIVNLSGSLFYKLKGKLPVVVPWLLVFSFVLSWSVGMSAYWDLYMGYSVLALNISGNVTFKETHYPHQSRCKCIFYIYSIVASLAFAGIILAGGTIITSLCKHMSRMKKNNERLGHSQIRTHLSAAKTVTALLTLYLIFYGAFSYLNNPVFAQNYIAELICLIAISSFPVVNALILIMGNRKLLNALKQAVGMKSNVINTEISIAAY